MLLKILVEGQVEEKFVKKILKPYLTTLGYEVSTIVNPTSPNAQGGLSHYQQFKKNAKNIKKDAPGCLLTTMIDLYNLPNDFPGMNQNSNYGDCYDKVSSLEEELAKDLDFDRFIPYIQLHEFEALLFSDIEIIVQVLGRTLNSSKQIQYKLRKILKEHGSPENINHGKGPANHIKEISIDVGFQKTVHGLRIAEEIGLSVMRENCPHFNEWLTELEKYIYNNISLRDRSQ